MHMITFAVEIDKFALKLRTGRDNRCAARIDDLPSQQFVPALRGEDKVPRLERSSGQLENIQEREQSYSTKTE